MQTRFTVILTEGDAGCRAELLELGISVACPTGPQAIRSLEHLVIDHCHTLLVRADVGTPEQRKLAEAIVRLADTPAT